MKTVKVTMTREQIQAAVDGVVYVTNGKLEGPGRLKMWVDTFPDEITLELPVVQVEIPKEEVTEKEPSKRKRLKIVGLDGGLMLATGFCKSNVRWVKEIELEEVE